MPKATALSEAIALTDEILALLDDQDFAAVADTELRRQSLIDEAFSCPVEEIDRIRASHLKNLNDQVVEKLQGLKQSVIEQQRQLRTATKATRAYGQHGDAQAGFLR